MAGGNHFALLESDDPGDTRLDNKNQLQACSPLPALPKSSSAGPTLLLGRSYATGRDSSRTVAPAKRRTRKTVWPAASGRTRRRAPAGRTVERQWRTRPPAR
ncbi:unnamed protein product [Urochloa humidicola]